jgi:hypothetical protein
MANISVTGDCNMACSYCFAREALEHLAPGRAMPRETFATALACLARSGVDEVRLLGGEPTLHPQFDEFVDVAMATGRRLVIFSNGLVRREAFDKLCDLAPERVLVVVNASAWLETPGAKPADVRDTLRALGQRAMLGINLHTRGSRLDGLLDMIRDLHLRPSLRLGLAHPILGGANRALHPKAYRQVGRSVSALARRATDRGVRLDFDCGFVPCMFEEPELPALDVVLSECGKRCNPLPDILPDGHVIACYPLARLGTLKLDDTSTVDDLRRRFETILAPYEGLGVFPECSACARLRERRCLGGCRAAALRRLAPPHFKRIAPPHSVASSWAEARPAVASTPTPGARVRAGPETPTVWAIPYVDHPTEFWQGLKEELGLSIHHVYFPLPSARVGTGRPPQPNSHLPAFLRWGGLASAVLVNPIVLPSPVENIAPAILAELVKLRDLYGIQAATVADINLAVRIREALPSVELTASTLMDIATPIQAVMLADLFDVLVPSSRILRDWAALAALRNAFPGRMRLIVNEGCLPGCPFRTQHFFEMQGDVRDPRSLCTQLLNRQPWLRLTGSWVLPHHLYLYEGLFDELKLDGRATLRDADKYMRVLRAYVARSPMGPNEIGGGPASLKVPMQVDEVFFRATLKCHQQCHCCTACADYYLARVPPSTAETP